MIQTVSGKTRVVGIIGSPISHSLSPVMHNAAFAACSLDYVYVPFAVAPDNLHQAVCGLKVLGVCGFNVTIPHKTAIIPYLDSLDESAESAGAVNTVVSGSTGFIGYNTDGDGLVDSLQMDLDFAPPSGRILIMGAGGAARGAIAALCRSGAKGIVICNRSQGKAEYLAHYFSVRYPDTCITVAAVEKMDVKFLTSISLVLNTTSLGMNGEEIKGFNPAHLPAHSKIYDMVYSQVVTPLVKSASSSGLRAVNGLGMLVAQGERAFKIWTGQNAPEGVMRQALYRI